MAGSRECPNENIRPVVIDVPDRDSKSYDRLDLMQLCIESNPNSPREANRAYWLLIRF